MNLSSCQPYTALFNLSREEYDGRSINSYLDWLKRTIHAVPNLIVFHDGTCDPIVENISGCKFIKIDKSDLKFFGFQSALISMLKNFTPESKNDLTFRLPEYALMQYSKFELGQIVAKSTKCTSLLWIDAGVSRFMDPKVKVPMELIKLNSEYLIRSGIDCLFEIDLRRNVNWFKLRIRGAEFGTCRRIISGTSFWINSSVIDKIENDIYSEVGNLIDSNKWDNEQVLLRNYLPKSNLNQAFLIQGRSPTGSIVRWFGNPYKYRYLFSNKVLEVLKF